MTEGYTCFDDNFNLEEEDKWLGTEPEFDYVPITSLKGKNLGFYW